MPLENTTFFRVRGCCAAILFILNFFAFAVIFELIFLLTALAIAVVTGKSRKSVRISMVSPLAVLNFQVTYAKSLDPPCCLLFRILEFHQPPQSPVVCSYLEVSSVNLVPHSSYKGQQFLPRHTVLPLRLR